MEHAEITIKIMENSTKEEISNQKPAEDKNLNIETVTPDLENVHPLSRQGVEKPKDDSTEKPIERNQEDPGADIETVSP